MMDNQEPMQDYNESDIDDEIAELRFQALLTKRENEAEISPSHRPHHVPENFTQNSLNQPLSNYTTNSYQQFRGGGRGAPSFKPYLSTFTQQIASSSVNSNNIVVLTSTQDSPDHSQRGGFHRGRGRGRGSRFPRGRGGHPSQQMLSNPLPPAPQLVLPQDKYAPQQVVDSSDGNKNKLSARLRRLQGSDSDSEDSDSDSSDDSSSDSSSSESGSSSSDSSSSGSDSDTDDSGAVKKGKINSENLAGSNVKNIPQGKHSDSLPPNNNTQLPQSKLPAANASFIEGKTRGISLKSPPRSSHSPKRSYKEIGYRGRSPSPKSRIKKIGRLSPLRRSRSITPKKFSPRRSRSPYRKYSRSPVYKRRVSKSPVRVTHSPLRKFSSKSPVKHLSPLSPVRRYPKSRSKSPFSKQKYGSRSPVRRYGSRSPPRFRSRSPVKRFGSRSPPLKRYGSRSPGIRRFGSKSPVLKRYRSRSPYSRPFRSPRRFSSRSPLPERRYGSITPPHRRLSRSPARKNIGPLSPRKGSPYSPKGPRSPHFKPRGLSPISPKRRKHSLSPLDRRYKPKSSLSPLSHKQRSPINRKLSDYSPGRTALSPQKIRRLGSLSPKMKEPIYGPPGKERNISPIRKYGPRSPIRRRSLSPYGPISPSRIPIRDASPYSRRKISPIRRLSPHPDGKRPFLPIPGETTVCYGPVNDYLRSPPPPHKVLPPPNFNDFAPIHLRPPPGDFIDGNVSPRTKRYPNTDVNLPQQRPGPVIAHYPNRHPPGHPDAPPVWHSPPPIRPNFNPPHRGGHRPERFHDGIRPEGMNEIVRFPEGIRPAQFPEGIRPERLPEGIRPKQFPVDNRSEHFPEGIRPERFPEGIRPERFPEGIRPEHFPEGIRPEHFPEGIRPEHFPEGIRHERFPEGIRPERFPEGIRFDRFPEGNMPPQRFQDDLSLLPPMRGRGNIRVRGRPPSRGVRGRLGLMPGRGVPLRHPEESMDIGFSSPPYEFIMKNPPPRGPPPPLMQPLEPFSDKGFVPLDRPPFGDKGFIPLDRPPLRERHDVRRSLTPVKRIPKGPQTPPYSPKGERFRKDRTSALHDRTPTLSPSPLMKEENEEHIEKREFGRRIERNDKRADRRNKDLDQRRSLERRRVREDEKVCQERVSLERRKMRENSDQRSQERIKVRENIDARRSPERRKARDEFDPRRSPERRKVRNDLDPRSQEQRKIRDEFDPISPERRRDRDDLAQRSPERRRARDDLDRRSQERRKFRDELDRKSPERRKVRDDLDRRSPERRKVRDDLDRRSPERRRARENLDRRSPPEGRRERDDLTHRKKVREDIDDKGRNKENSDRMKIDKYDGNKKLDREKRHNEERKHGDTDKHRREKEEHRPKESLKENNKRNLHTSSESHRKGHLQDSSHHDTKRKNVRVDKNYPRGSESKDKSRNEDNYIKTSHHHSPERAPKASRHKRDKTPEKHIEKERKIKHSKSDKINKKAINEGKVKKEKIQEEKESLQNLDKIENEDESENEKRESSLEIPVEDNQDTQEKSEEIQENISVKVKVETKKEDVKEDLPDFKETEKVESGNESEESKHEKVKLKKKSSEKKKKKHKDSEKKMKKKKKKEEKKRKKESKKKRKKKNVPYDDDDEEEDDHKEHIKRKKTHSKEINDEEDLRFTLKRGEKLEKIKGGEKKRKNKYAKVRQNIEDNLWETREREDLDYESHLKAKRDFADRRNRYTSTNPSTQSDGTRGNKGLLVTVGSGMDRQVMPGVRRNEPVVKPHGAKNPLNTKLPVHLRLGRTNESKLPQVGPQKGGLKNLKTKGAVGGRRQQNDKRQDRR